MRKHSLNFKRCFFLHTSFHNRLFSFSNSYPFLRFGRKLILRWCLFQLAVAGTCVAFAPTFFVYCTLRFLAGLSVMTILLNSNMLSKSTFLILYICHALILKQTFHLCLKSKSCLCFLSVLEWTLPQFQALGTTLAVCSYSVGQIILGSLAYAIGDWRTLQLVFSVPVFVIVLSSGYKLSLGFRGSWNERCMQSGHMNFFGPWSILELVLY